MPGERICVTKRAVLSCSSLLALEAPSEVLDVMESSPNLPLHFADENLEPSASYGVNTFVDRFAAAMKRSTSPNTGSKNTKTGDKSEAQLIETAPRDGGFLILEEDTSGKYDIARWASEAGGWVRENGEPIKITPSYWYSIKGENYRQHGLDISTGPFQTEGRAAPQQQFTSDIITSRSDAAPPETVATAKLDATAVDESTPPVRSLPALSWRYASACISGPSRICGNLCCRNATVSPNWLVNSPRLAAALRQRLRSRARPPRKRIGLGRRRTPRRRSWSRSAVGRPRLPVTLKPRNA